MQYTETSPRAELRPFVDCFWHAELDAPPGHDSVKSILPDGYMEMLSIDGDVTIEHSRPGTLLRPNQPILVGQLRRSITLRPRGRVSITSVRFRPGGAAAFLDTPIYRLTDAIVPLSELGAGRLVSHLRRCPHGRPKIQLLSSWLHDQLSSGADDGITAPAVLSILSRGGCGRVDELATQLDISARHLERRFREIVGLPPKVLARIVRFSGALELLKVTPCVSWSQISCTTGFSDQAHFIREFRHFSGLRPTVVRAGSPEDYWCTGADSKRGDAPMSDLFNTPCL